MALVKYNNNSISAVTSAASIPSGALVPIKTLTASSSSTLSFVHGSSDVILDSTYPIYLFKFINIHPATDNTEFQFQGSTNSGSSYGVTITSTFFRAYHDEADTGTALQYQTSKDLAQSTSFQMLAEYGNDNDQSTSGELYLFNPSSTTFVKHFMSNFNFVNGSNYSMNTYCAGYFNSTSAIDAIQFKTNSGNTDAGTIKLYGIKDS